MAYEQILTVTPQISAANYTVGSTLNVVASSYSVQFPVNISNTTYGSANVLAACIVNLSAGIIPGTASLSATSITLSVSAPGSLASVVYAGSLKSSTFSATASSVLATVTFSDPNLYNTVLALSANSTNTVILTGSSTLDNLFYVTTPYVSLRTTFGHARIVQSQG